MSGRNTHPVILALAILGAAVACFLWLRPSMGPRDATDAANCQNDLCFLWTALKAYEADNGQLPAAGGGSDGSMTQPSWRVALLPYLEYSHVYAQYKQDEPWNGESNSALATRLGTPREYRSPVYDNPQPDCTQYVAVVGPGTAWDPDGPRRLADLSETTPDLILLVDSPMSDIHWMEPRDLSLEQMSAEAIARRDREGVPRLIGRFVLFADGQAWQLNEDCPESEIAKFFTIEGARKYHREEVLGPYRR